MKKSVLFSLMISIIFSTALAGWDPLQDDLERGNFENLLMQSKAAVYTEENAHNYYYLGSAYAGLGRHNLADPAYQKALDYPFAIEIGNEIAAYYEERQNISKAAAVYEKIVKEFPTDSQTAVLKLGDLYYKEKKYQEAVDTFTKYINENENLANPLAYYVGLSYYALNDEVNAEKYLDLALAKGFQNAECLVKSGELKIKRGEFQSGIDQINKGLALSPDQSVGTYQLLGDGQAKLSDYTGAMNSYRQAIQRGGTSSGLYLDYATNASQIQNFQGIVDLLEPKSKNNLKNAEFLYYLGNAYDRLGVPVQAIEYYQKALDAGYANRTFLRNRMNQLSAENENS